MSSLKSIESKFEGSEIFIYLRFFFQTELDLEHV